MDGCVKNGIKRKAIVIDWITGETVMKPLWDGTTTHTAKKTFIEMIKTLQRSFASEMANTTQYIMNYAMQNQTFCIANLLCMLPEDNTISLSSIKSTITRLVHSNRLARVKRGVYSFVPPMKNSFAIILGEKEKQLNRQLKEKFPFATFCIYNGETLAPLQHHLSFNHATYIETERIVMESAFEYLRAKGYVIFLNPKSDIVSTYIDLRSAPIILKPLKTESPTTEQEGIVVPTLEKMLVDIQKDADFSYLQGAENAEILSNAESLYMINHSRMNRYGRRRNLNNDRCKVSYNTR